jgi:cytidylate kinase
MRPVIIAVDGTAGSGKSSVCRGVASRLGLQYLDTGAMYRAMTWAVLHAGIDVHESAAVAAHAPGVVLTSGTDPAAPTIHVGDADVTVAVRGADVTAAVSAVSAVPAVRQALVAQQQAAVARAVAAGSGIVVEGRDITTVVLPDADLKLFVTADPAVRAARRAAQDVELGRTDVDVNATEAALRARDATDSRREASPLTQAPDAVVVDTSHVTLAESIAQVVDLVGARVGSP